MLVPKGKSVKPTNTKKGGTASTRRFSYQSFSQKIANLKIDPVRRVRRYVDDEEAQKSFFRPALESWIEMNLSSNFTQFSKEVLPLTDSLPHILHYQNLIMDLLVKYIKLEDIHSLEPLLDLLAQFARDLGEVFESHFARAVTLLSSIVVKHSDVSVIEWTFNCLAFLLKYLSRLLVPDLRPLFSILSPQLGKEKQKPFAVRFVAEALSFLIRKSKDEPLRVFIRHVFQDLQDNRNSRQYVQGLSSLFLESCVSVENTIHSKGPTLVKVLCEVAEALGSFGPAFDVVQGVIIGVIHHTQGQTFTDIQNTIYEFMNKSTTESTAGNLEMRARLLYVIFTVRKGSRITDWVTGATLLLDLLDYAISMKNDKIVREIAKASAVLLQTADMDVVISKGAKIIEGIQKCQGGSLFWFFCDFYARLGSERFQRYLLRYFQCFVSEHWAVHEHILLGLVPKLSSGGYLMRIPYSKDVPELPDTSKWVDAIATSITEFNQALQDELDERSNLDAMDTSSGESGDISPIWAKLEVLPALVLSGKAPKQLEGALVTLARTLLPYCDSMGYQRTYVALYGKLLSVCWALGLDVSEPKAWNFLQNALPVSGQLIPLLRGANHFLKAYEGKPSHGSYAPNQKMIDALLAILKGSNSDARKLSLECLGILYKLSYGTSSNSDVIDLSLTIEESKPSLESAKSMAMYIRRLGSSYTAIPQDSWVSKLIPYHLFGLLTMQFSPIWNDAIEALGKVADVNSEIVSTLTFDWLQSNSTNDSEAQKAKTAQPSAPMTSFECSNLCIIDKVSDQCKIDLDNIAGALKESLNKALQVLTLPVHIARSQALKVLCELPHLAEKRSRQLVPLFLEWARADSLDEDIEGAEEEILATWSKKDRATMLVLFSKFINPKVLYKSDTVYEALLYLLKSGDPRVQLSALRCILTWKTPAILAYASNLENLLNETLFRDELTKFIQVDEEESIIQSNHREALMPVLLRILYGRTLSRKNASSGTKGMASRRTVILAALANFRSEEQAMFIDITLGDLAGLQFIEKADLGIQGEYRIQPRAPGKVNVSFRKQLGFIRMMQDMLKQLGSNLLPLASKLLDALLYCLISSGHIGKTAEADEMVSESESESESGHSSARFAKAVRQRGLRALNNLFISCPTFAWTPYISIIFEYLVIPRLKKLPCETSQSPSCILQLLYTWAGSHHTVLFLTNYDDVIPRVAECLTSPSAKDEVLQFIFKMLQKIVGIANSIDDEQMENMKIAEAVQAEILRPYIGTILTKIGEVLQRSPSKEVLESGIETVSQLAPFVVGFETTQLVRICVFLLNQPSKRVNPRTKSGILKILRHFLPLCEMKKGDELFEDTFQSVSSLFGYFKDRESREALGIVFNVFSGHDHTLEEVGSLCQQLNSFSKRRIDEPDFEQRLQAYAAINEKKYQGFNSRQWLPLVYNMLYFVKDNEELAIRTNASYALRRFVEVAGQKWMSGEKDDYLQILNTVLLPALRAGAREPSELVRMEYVNVMSHLVKSCSDWEEVLDMQALLVGDDEEANFFNNILHIQQHRRARALRRLASSAQKNHLQSSNIAHFFLPLIEHFIFDQEGGDSHQLAAESIMAVSSLAEQLTWSQFKALFKRYIGYIKSKQEIEKTVIRLVGITVDSLSRAWVESPNNFIIEARNCTLSIIDEEGDTEMKSVIGHLAENLPSQDTLVNELLNSFIPTLSAYLNHKDETTVSLRVPVAVSLVKLLRLLPEKLLQQKLPGVLTDVCHILRSRAQDSRDMTRKTLTEITALLGPQYFSFIIRELRGALLRGYQLHVLSFTMHSILVTVVPTYKPGALDYCLSEMMDVVMDDIFGVTGMEKDAEGYISKMKEVKSSKSYDTVELLASTAALSSLNKIVRPIQALLQENVTLKLVKKIDELLRRIGLGLLKNEAVNSRDLLVFCYEVVQEGYIAATAAEKSSEKPVNEQVQRYLVNLKAPSKTPSQAITSSYVYKLIRFSLDIMRVVLTKYDNLMTPENLAGWVRVIGDAVLSNHEEVRVSALRLLTTIIRVQLPSIDYGVPVFIKQCMSFVKSCPSTNAEIAQASLKLTAAILHERNDVTVKESAIAYILTRIKPDIKEPDRQGITFNFIKAVLNRKINIPEVYEVLDDIAQVMVTNQTRSVRDLARGTYVQFIMEYPQGKDRLKKQFAFLMKNLDYPHQTGRSSVLEAIYLLIMKIGESLIQDVIGTFFVPLVMVLVNDDSSDCREMAGALIKKIMERADNVQMATFMNLARQWLDQNDQSGLIRLALQLYGLYFEVFESRGLKEVSAVTDRLLGFLENTSYDGESKDESTGWELVYFSLQLWAKIAQLFPQIAFSGEKLSIWQAVRNCLSYPHSWIRLSSAKLTGLFFAGFAKSPLDCLPLVNGKGLTFDSEAMVITARRTTAQLNSLELTEELALQVVKNLLFLGRCFHANKLSVEGKSSEEEDLGDEEIVLEVQVDNSQKSALLWLFGRISAVIRNESNMRKIVLGKSSAIKWLAAMTQVIPGEELVPLAPTMIMPLYNLIDSPENDLIKDLKVLAQEALGMLQSRMGVTTYGQAYIGVKEAVQEKRKERKHKRSIQQIADPERAAVKKMKKHERKKVVRKEKAAEHRAKRREM
ncbi:armadillo-type protein [Tirmania nivea]|nr:armadillo-type protein [Tirmania nivea]